MDENRSNNSKRIALVIGAGGTKCAAAIGLWKVLQRENINIDLLVGASGGSLYAGAIALGLDVRELELKTLDLWTPEIIEGYTTQLKAAMSGQMPFSELSGLVDDQRLFQRLAAIYGESSFNEVKIPLRVVATDLYHGERVIISTGKILDAVRASISIPFLFPPYPIDGQYLVDGAVSDPLPIDIAIQDGADIIFAMGFELPIRKRMRTYSAVTAHFNSLYMNNILRSSFAFHNLAHHAEIISFLPDFNKQIGSFDNHLVPMVIKAGEETAEEQLPYIRQLIQMETHQ
jgi:NTE family protein